MKLSTDDLPMMFGDAHVALAERLRAVAPKLEAVEHPEGIGSPDGSLARLAGDEAARDRAAVIALADAGLFELVVGKVDARSLCLAREMLGYVSARADSILAVQGLGTHPISLAGSAEQRAQLPAYARGAAVAAFALTEPEAGSDVAAIQTRAAPCPEGYRLDGDKLFISNLGIADHAVVFAKIDDPVEPGSTSRGPGVATRGSGGLSAFWVPLDTPGVRVTIQTATAPHPIGALELRGAIVPVAARIGDPGSGMKLALQTLDAFRVSVGAAAVGMARRAFDEALTFVCERKQFGKPLVEQQLVQGHLADMQVDLDAARLLVLRAAYLKDTTGGKITMEVSIAKLGATEAASRVIDRAVQLFGGRGVMQGSIVEHLYRAIRPLRIYEGTSEIQRTIIGRALAATRGQ